MIVATQNVLVDSGHIFVCCCLMKDHSRGLLLLYSILYYGDNGGAAELGVAPLCSGIAWIL